jgi:hypothetical protein
MPPPTTEEQTRLMDKLLAESREALRSQKLAQDQAGIEWAINATPTGEARNALTIANIFLTHAQDVLAGRPTPTSLDDLAQQVATERYDAAMQRAAQSRTIGEEAKKAAPPTRAVSQTYPLQGIDCLTHGPQTVLTTAYERRGTTYVDGSYDTRRHEHTGCGCHFDVWYYHVHADFPVADSVTIVHNPS